ncbi:fimbrial protein [Pantoea agglomerans]|uniref:fimbrial protein n=1 Tax=Enterobacter agglomerans TaxID=549 RepID=UPI00301C48B6
MKKLSKIASLILSKTMLSALVIWLWSASCSAYDFSVTCYGDNGLCGPGVNFTLTKISTAHDAVPLPFTPNGVQFYLANCPSDTSCTKLVGPFWEKVISYPAWEEKTWGNLGTKFLSPNNILNGAITGGINAGTGDVWNPNAYKNLCFSIMGGNYSGWSIWGINYTYPMGTVMCSVPINRVVADTCSVSTPSIDVAFGQLERSEISTTLPASNDVSKTLTLNCTGTSVHNFAVKLNMTPVSWSNSQITTSNSVLGISVSKDGTVLNNGSSFDMSVTASGSAGLVFSVLRNPSQPSSSIATGDFTASATLVVTEQ